MVTGLLKYSMDKSPQQWCWLHKRGSRAFPNGRLLGWNFRGEGGLGGLETGGLGTTSVFGCGVIVLGIVGTRMDEGSDNVGLLGAEGGNGPDE